MSESDKKSSSDNTPSDKPPSSQAKCPDTPEPKKVSQFGNNFHSQLNSIIENLKSIFKSREYFLFAHFCNIYFNFSVLNRIPFKMQSF